MKWIRNTSLRQKLITGFLIINILLIGIGVVGILGIRQVSENAELMYDNYLQSIDDLHQIRGNLLHSDMTLQYVKQAGTRSDIDRMSGGINDLTEKTNNRIRANSNSC